MNKWDNTGRGTTQNFGIGVNEARYYKKENFKNKNIGIDYSNDFIEDDENFVNKKFIGPNYTKSNGNISQSEWKDTTSKFYFFIKDSQFFRNNKKFKNYNNEAQLTNSNQENSISTNYNNKSTHMYMKVNYQGKNYNTGNVKASVTSPRINYSTYNGSIQPNQSYSSNSEKNVNLNANANMYTNKTNKETNFQFLSEKDNSVSFLKQSQQSSRKEKESNLNYSNNETLNDNYVIQNSNKVFLENIPCKQSVSPGNFYINPKNKAYSSQSSQNNYIKNNTFYMQPWGGNMNLNMNMVNHNMNMINPNPNSNSNYFMMPGPTSTYFFDPYATNATKMPVQFDPSNQNRKNTNTNTNINNTSNSSNKAYTERNFANKPPQLITNINANQNANQKFNSNTGRDFLTISIKIKEEETGKVIYLKRGEDYFKKATEFCKVNKLNNKLVKPIFNSIGQASEAIDKVMSQETSSIDGRYLESIRKTWKESKEQLDEQEEGNLNLSCMTCLTNGESEELFGYESIETILSSSF